MYSYCREANNAAITATSCVSRLANEVITLLRPVTHILCVTGSYPMDQHKCYKAKRYSDVLQKGLQLIPHSDIDMQTGSIDDEYV